MARRPGRGHDKPPGLSAVLERHVWHGDGCFRESFWLLSPRKIPMPEKSKSTGKAKDDLDLEILPDAWERFERAVDTVIKSGPQHRQWPHDERKERPASKGRVHKGKARD